MASNPRNILKSFARLDQQQKEDDKLEYQFKVVQLLAPALELDMPAIKGEYYALRDNAPELFMDAIKDLTSGGLPPCFFIDHRHKVKFEALALKGEQTYWFKQFLERASSANLSGAALIFPVMGRKDWVIHNLPITRTPGIVRLCIPSAIDEVGDVHITPLTQFLKEYTHGR